LEAIIAELKNGMHFMADVVLNGGERERKGE
jgi:hypothetical protein